MEKNLLEFEETHISWLYHSKTSCNVILHSKIPKDYRSQSIKHNSFYWRFLIESGSLFWKTFHLFQRHQCSQCQFSFWNSRVLRLQKTKVFLMILALVAKLCLLLAQIFQITLSVQRCNLLEPILPQNQAFTSVFWFFRWNRDGTLQFFSVSSWQWYHGAAWIYPKKVCFCSTLIFCNMNGKNHIFWKTNPWEEIQPILQASRLCIFTRFIPKISQSILYNHVHQSYRKPRTRSGSSYTVQTLLFSTGTSGLFHTLMF